jgi:hypothetical protein
MITMQTSPDTAKISSGTPTGNEITIAIKHLKFKKVSSLDNLIKFSKPIHIP